MTDKQYADQLDKHLSTYGKENQFIEFKSNYQEAWRLGKYISALSNGATLANQDYGYLYFGVDDTTLEINGTTFAPSSTMATIKDGVKSKQPLELYLRQNITPRIHFSIKEISSNNGKKIVFFEIPAAKGEPTCFQKIPYVRVDSCVTELREYQEWMRRIYNSSIDWSSVIIENSDMDDLDHIAIAKAREGYKERNPDIADIVDSWTDETFLDKAKITINGQITRTALLLLGKSECSYKLGHIAQIVWKLQTDKESAGEIFNIPFILATSAVNAKIRNYRFKIYPENSLIPAEVWKYNTRNNLEALHNCIAHQDYLRNERIIVTEHDDCIIFENGGCFFDGEYEEYIEGHKSPRRYRNPFLANAMENIKMIDTRGLGIHWMFDRQRRSYLPMPEYDRSLTDSVRLIITGCVIDVNYSLTLMNFTSLDLTTVYLLDRVQKQQPISDDAIISLRRQGLIEGRKPNIHVSKKVAGVTHTETDYSKLKGLDDSYYRDFILKAIADHPHKKWEKQDFIQLLNGKLPESLTEKQKVNKIKNLLTSLRAKELITYSQECGWVLT